MQTPFEGFALHSRLHFASANRLRMDCNCSNAGWHRHEISVGNCLKQIGTNDMRWSPTYGYWQRQETQARMKSSMKFRDKLHMCISLRNMQRVWDGQMRGWLSQVSFILLAAWSDESRATLCSNVGKSLPWNVQGGGVSKALYCIQPIVNTPCIDDSSLVWSDIVRSIGVAVYDLVEKIAYLIEWSKSFWWALSSLLHCMEPTGEL